MKPAPEFTFDNPNCHQQAKAEWEAHSAGREYSIVPQGWQPCGDRPKALECWEEDR